MTRYCQSCGYPNEDHAAFCISCGAAFDPLQRHRADDVPAQERPDQYLPPRYPDQAPEPSYPPIKRRRGVVAGVIAVVAILIIAAIGGLILYKMFVPIDIPSPLAPANGATLDGHYPEFSWTEVSDAERYQILVLGEGNTEIMDDIVTDAVVISDSYLGDGIYEWSVRAEVGGKWSDWSDENTFFIGSSTLNRHYEWDFDGRTWTWDVMIASGDYLYYHQKPRTYDYASYMTDDNAYIESLAAELSEIADEEGWSSYELVSFALAFVQSLEYTSDSVTTGYDEYPRYPLETLVDNGGDCEDTSILLASLVQADPINIDAVLLLLPSDSPEHMATGVAGEEGITGYYFSYDDRRYYYCETTGEGWELGDMPNEYMGVSAEIIPV